ncbi:polyisoprenoid-binding protein YceI [Rhodopseudomonas julia]|uniref:Polyisoprenoid-binding protein YceI n=1 Tax=Rhodopseudomonas julia TaxID=200617 RepID=A0ABU0C163_9BRAD|nr:YceI family protein [Rhodopseudomonas julia]MDQ0324235.1 polyisoprenoid-binding protein YceI [Rhodopseudomonas julia]
MRVILAAAIALAAGTALAQPVPTATEQPGQAEPARIEAGTYQVDPDHTQVTWTVNHLGFSMLEGLFGASEGSITIDPKNPSGAKVEVTFPIDAVRVTLPEFGEHLQSAEFFNAAQYPAARFVSTSVTVAEGNKATIVGDLTIKDQTKPVTIDAVLVGAGTNPMTDSLNFGFYGSTTIKRSDFGLGAYAPAVSDDVQLEINAAFVKP